MDAQIENIIAELQRQLAPLKTKEESLSAELVTVKEQQKQLKAALKVLGHSPKRSKPCVTTELVKTAIANVLAEHGPDLESAKLEELVKKKIVASGRHSLSGFALRMKQVKEELGI